MGIATLNPSCQPGRHGIAWKHAGLPWRGSRTPGWNPTHRKKRERL